MTPLLEIRGAIVEYRLTGGARLRAVDSASFTIAPGEIVGLVGESGSGKTSLGRAILKLVPLAGGEIRWQGQRIDAMGRRAFRPLRKEMQIVFQDPLASFDPRMTIAQSVAEPIRGLEPRIGEAARDARAGSLLSEFGLEGMGDRYPHQLSGGQLQRAGIARALAVGPRFVVCDEPVSALDVSVQGQIVNLLARVQRERGLASLFISHNLAVVAHLAARITVMYLGRIVELASREAIVHAPLHPYSRSLLDSVLTADPAAARRRLARTRPAAPKATNGAATGCAYAGRCPHAIERCVAELPPLREFPGGRLVACHRADDWPAGLPSSAIA